MSDYDDDDEGFTYSTEDRITMKNTGTATKKVEFTYDGKDYRVIAIGKYSSGYSDSLLIQVKDKDVLGDTLWLDFTAEANKDSKTYKMIEMIVALAQKVK